MNKNDFFLFDNEKIFNIFFEYVKKRYKFKNLGNGFIIRKVGKIKRLHYAIDDIIDWWDINLSKDDIENMLKNEFYYKAVFKNILEFSNIKNVLDSLNIKPKNISFSKVYYIDFRELDSEEKLLKSFSYKHRRNIKNLQNRIKKIKSAFFRIESIDNHFDILRKMLVKRHEKTIWSDDEFCISMKEILNYFEDLNILDCFIMKSEEEIITINVVLKYNKRAFWWITAFNEKFYYYSPDTVSLWYMLKHYLKEGFIEFNFMRGESEYKTRWTNRFYKLYRYEFEHPNLFKKIFSFML